MSCSPEGRDGKKTPRAGARQARRFEPEPERNRRACIIARREKFELPGKVLRKIRVGPTTPFRSAIRTLRTAMPFWSEGRPLPFLEDRSMKFPKIANAEKRS